MSIAPSPRQYTPIRAKVSALQLFRLLLFKWLNLGEGQMNYIRILDYGSGNIGAYRAIGARIGIEILPTSVPTDITGSELLIVPGVGNVGECMTLLENSGYANLLKERFIERRPILAVCSGFQIFGERSSETPNELLSLLPLEFLELDSKFGPVPQMGWRHVKGMDSILPSKPVYFSHGYHGKITEAISNVLTSHYNRGSEQILASIRTPSFAGAQFHPEKSNLAGRIFLKKVIRELIDA